MTSHATPAARLAEKLSERRLALRLQWQEVADRAKVSTAHLRNIRNGDAALSSLAKANLEEALRWAPGSVDRILDGGEPVEIAEVSGAAGMTLPALTAHAKADVQPADTEPSPPAEPLTGEASVVAQIEKLLALNAKVQAEKIDELNKKIDEMSKQLEEQRRRSDEQGEERNHRRGA